MRLGNSVDEDRSESLDNPLTNPGDWTSATFTYPPTISNPQWGYLAVGCSGSNRQSVFETAIWFSIDPP